MNKYEKEKKNSESKEEAKPDLNRLSKLNTVTHRAYGYYNEGKSVVRFEVGFHPELDMAIIVSKEKVGDSWQSAVGDVTRIIQDELIKSRK